MGPSQSFPFSARPGLIYIPDESVKSCMHPRCQSSFDSSNSFDKKDFWRCYSCGYLQCSQHSKWRESLPTSNNNNNKNKSGDIECCLGCRNLLQHCSKEPVLQLFHLSLLGCYKLTPTTDLQNLKLVKKLPFRYLTADPDHGDERLGKLKEIDVSVLSSVEEIPMQFLSHLCNLQSIDLSSLVKLKRSNVYFLGGCTSLTSVILPPNLEFIDQSFIAESPKLSKVHFLDQVNLRSLLELPPKNIAEFDNKRLKKELEFLRVERRINLVSFKSSLRIGKILLSQEWVPRRLIFEFACPVRS